MPRLQAGFGISVATVEADAVDQALAAALAAMDQTPPALILLGVTVAYDMAAIVERIRSRLPGVPLHGLTSALGLLSQRGVCVGADGRALGLLLLGGPGLEAAVAGVEVGDDPVAAGRRAAEQLRERLPTPRLLLFNASPGHEEALLAGVAQVFPDVPAYGGSAADNSLTGEWWIVSDDRLGRDALSLAGIGGALRCGGALLAPYEDTGESTMATAEGRRLLTLDERPAAEALRAWIGESVAAQAERGGPILTESALQPLALRLDTGLGIHYLTIHPAVIEADSGAVSVFARLGNRQRLCRMRSDPERLTGSIALLLQRALEDAGVEDDEVRAILLIYCAGCAGAVGSELHAALQQHLAELEGVPLLGLCTFGEQGPAGTAGNIHANLSLAMVVFADG